MRLKEPLGHLITHGLYLQMLLLGQVQNTVLLVALLKFQLDAELEAYH
ncbi:MAG: hypothetical protein CENE_03466 [Candidatus Celerinatantimonas neptuna]|nr:MAG: hypothetical protein CENE_03466 [Candidatus Celerinatantimonas neptuna]